MEFLNDYSGLFSLLAVVASVAAVVVAVWIYRKQKKETKRISIICKKKTKNISIKSNKTSIFKIYGMSMRL